MPMTLKDFSVKQLIRIYIRLELKVSRDMFGADWVTLRITNRSLYDALRAVYDELVSREDVCVRGGNLELV